VKKILFIVSCILLSSQAFSAVSPVLPATSREWQGSDYRLAAEIYTTRTYPLPRLSDREGARVLERLTARENLSFHRNKSLPVEVRLNDFAQLIVSANTIAKLYIEPESQSGSRTAETALFMAFLVRASGVGADLMSEYIPSIPKDENYNTRMSGLTQFGSGLASVTNGAVITIGTERFHYSPQDLSRLIEALAEAMPSLRSFMKEDFRRELAVRLRSIKSSYPRLSDQRNIDATVTSLDERISK
jgi:hypothetical protein